MRLLLLCWFSLRSHHRAIWVKCSPGTLRSEALSICLEDALVCCIGNGGWMWLDSRCSKGPSINLQKKQNKKPLFFNFSDKNISVLHLYEMAQCPLLDKERITSIFPWRSKEHQLWCGSSCCCFLGLIFTFCLIFLEMDRWTEKDWIQYEEQMLL